MHFRQSGWRADHNGHRELATISYVDLAPANQPGCPGSDLRARMAINLPFEGPFQPSVTGYDLVVLDIYRSWADGLVPSSGALDDPAAFQAVFHYGPDPLLSISVAPKRSSRPQAGDAGHVEACHAPCPPGDVPADLQPESRREWPGLATVETPRFDPLAWSDLPDELLRLRQVLAMERDRQPTLEQPCPDEACSAVRSAFDRAFYCAMNQDVAAAGIDALVHYGRHGWREGRDPTPWFSVADYLRNNPDVADAEVEPFQHYLQNGRAEGRPLLSSVSALRRKVLDDTVDPDERTRGYVIPEHDTLSPEVLANLLRDVGTGASGFVLSVSHDLYLRHTGGVQLFIAEEQRAFAARSVRYLHISPLRPLLRLGDDSAGSALLNVTLDGVHAGVTSYQDLTGALAELTPGCPRTFIVHCLLGHDTVAIQALQAVLGTDENLFWLHDYSSLCLGYTLLRNDVAFCGAPPVGSLACRVCVYGDRRPGHIRAIEALFEAIPFRVIAPSRSALRVWQAGFTAPYVRALVHPHADLRPDLREVDARRAADPATCGSLANPVRVAFIGFRGFHKGGPIWAELTRRCAGLGAYAFSHLGSKEALQQSSHVAAIEVSTTTMGRDAMARTIAENGFDLVVLPSTWPETFSYVTFEAMAGGADVVCLEASGNVADAVRHHRRGVIAPDETALFGFFESLQAVAYVRRRRSEAPQPLILAHHGTSATLGAPGPG